MANPQTTNHDEEHVFFNVLPRERAGGPLVNKETSAAPVQSPTVSNETTEAPSISEGVPAASLFSRINKRLVIIILVAVVLLAGGGFGLYKFVTKDKTPVEVNSNTNTAPTNTEPKEPQQPEGVSTPSDWQQKYFGSNVCQNVSDCGDAADPDKDGLSNLEEHQATTDPNNPDSSGGGMADGDKVHVFHGDPLKTKTKDGQYTDSEYAKYGYDINTDQPYTADQLNLIKAAIKQYGLHEPTITTLGAEALGYYDFTGVVPAQDDTDALKGVDLSANAKLDRDTQRSDTIKKIGAALIQYQAAKQVFPDTSDFTEMTNAIKPYLQVATNFADPINKGKYVYGYMVGDKAADFTLTYFSETQNLLIKYKSANAQADITKQSSNDFDAQRQADLESLRLALLLYSGHYTDPNSTVQYVFPTVEKYKTDLVPTYISQIPKDPKTKADYAYTVSSKFDSFTLKAAYDSPQSGGAGYLCDESECRNY